MSKLYLVPTPIGNLEDITVRALRILKEVSVILAEDTRTSSKLLKHYEISTPLQAHHQHNEHKAVQSVVKKILAGVSVALISDAGTPGISDPGFLLVRACLENEIEVECLPGATAFVPALVCSGIACDRFSFEGFLPHKKGRQGKIQEFTELSHTIVLYESPHRIAKTLLQLSEALGEERKACVSREITKLHEEHKRGTLLELRDFYLDKTVKGEIVLTVEGKSDFEKRLKKDKIDNKNELYI